MRVGFTTNLGYPVLLVNFFHRISDLIPGSLRVTHLIDEIPFLSTSTFQETTYGRGQGQRQGGRQ